MNNSKSWYQSWTVWFNLALIVISTINSMATFIPFGAKFLAVVALIGNILLRFKSNQPITLN